MSIMWRGERKKRMRRSWVSAVSRDARPLLRDGISPLERMTRIHAVFCVIGLLCATLVFRLFQLQNSQHGQWLDLASRQQDTSVEIQRARGTVIDSAGRSLAVSVPTVSVAIHPGKVTDRDSAKKILASVVGLPANEINTKLNSRKSFVWLERGVSQDRAQRIKELKLEGIVLVPEYSRLYPQGSIGGPILGRVSRDGLGQAGVELQFNEDLSRDFLTVAVRRDARGRLVAPDYSNQGGFGVIRSFFLSDEAASHISLASHAKRPRNLPPDEDSLPSVQLSIDSAIQDILERELKQGVSDARAKRGMGLIMDADTGELLAVAQTPSFDPNDSSVSPSEFKNLALHESFEPGSTLKPLVAAAAIQAGVVKIDELIDGQNGSFQFGRKTIRDVHGVGVIPFSEALVRSSNVCMTKVGLRLGKERLQSALAKFGLGTRTGIELPGEETGILRSQSAWRDIDVATHSFGHGVSVTALQLARAFSAIVNGGYLVSPTILKRAVGSEVVKEQVLDTHVSEQLYKTLIGVTANKEGTAHQAALKFLPVSGKTGTAHKMKIGAKGYDPERVLASFIGFVDGREQGISRRVTAYIIIDEPGVNPRWGGVVAAPVFRRVMEQILPHLMTGAESGRST